MNTLDELKYYCNEKDPAGALMLQGEWGCGKTYLLEHRLAKDLEETHIFARVSLFGICNVEAINNAIKKQWIAQCHPILNKLQENKRLSSAGNSLLNIISSLDPRLKSAKDIIVAINPWDYITIKPEVEVNGIKKKVVLIFDDLERSNIDTVEVLGCINEYCENLHFNTIIVANEEKISDEIDSDNTNKKKISYSEIKEKCVSRTICYNPDFDIIIDSLLDGKIWFSEEYTSFLRDNKPLLMSLLATEPIENTQDMLQKPHNIRSLKCAFQDFYRVYAEMKKEELQDISSYLCSFIAYTMAERGGIVKEGEYGLLLSDIAIRKIYPLYKDNTMLPAIQQWIHSGIWDAEALAHQIEATKQRTEKLELKDKLRLYRWIDLEENEIFTGFIDYMQDVYAGEISYGDYVLLVANSIFVREYEITIPEEIEWERVIEGIKTRAQRNREAGEDEHSVYQVISDERQKLFTDQEKQAYELIYKLQESNLAMFDKNRKLFLDELKENGIGAFMICRNKRFNVFDEEMAKATALCYKTCSQADKAMFWGCFKSIWRNCELKADVNLKETQKGIDALIQLLQIIEKEYRDEERNIAKKHTEIFINGLIELSEKLKATKTTDTDPIIVSVY